MFKIYVAYKYLRYLMYNWKHRSWRECVLISLKLKYRRDLGKQGECTWAHIACNSSVAQLICFTYWWLHTGASYNVFTEIWDSLLTKSWTWSFCHRLNSMYETCSLILRQEHTLRVFGNRVLRRLFGPKRVEVTGGWRKLHNEELHNVSSPSIIRMIKSRRMRWAGYVARMGRRGIHIWYWWERQKERDHYEDKNVDNILMDLREVEWVGTDWIELAQDRPSGGILWTCYESSGSVKCWQVLQ
jgi:hypothetical protein